MLVNVYCTPLDIILFGVLRCLQLTDPRAAATALASPRSCATSHPTFEIDGLLFVWMDATKEGRAAEAAAPKPTIKEAAAGVTYDSEWVMNEVGAWSQCLQSNLHCLGRPTLNPFLNP